MPQLRSKRSYATDPNLCDRVFDLLDTWIPDMSARRRAAETLRWRWEDCSTPFVTERDGRVLAHVGLLDTHIVWGDRRLRAGGLHAVCTLASERRRGLFRALMEDALAYCADRYEMVKLCTENPEYYEPFGFRTIAEHRFRFRVDSGPGRAGFRALDAESPADLDLLDRRLACRTPVSGRLGVVRDQDLFKFNLGNRTVLYSDDLDLVAVMQFRDGRLRIDDLVGGELPALDDLLARIAEPIDEVVLHFRPDKLGVEARAEPVRPSGDVLMVRGSFPPDDGPPVEFMLPPLARH